MSKQQDSSAIYNILAFRFDGRKGAEEALKQAKSSGALEGYTIADVDMFETIGRICIDCREICRTGGVGHGVDINHFHSARDRHPNHSRTDEARSARQWFRSVLITVWT